MSDPAIRFESVGKMYKIFSSRRAHLLDALGIERFALSAGSKFREFWALRGVELELYPGQRLGIIGRNGAGKSTLLKLVTGNIEPSEGTVRVSGNVQALLEIGGGLHPEFTGRENIHAALGFLGLNRAESNAATEDIAAFTELGRFLDQPFKTYSQGMQARLSFAIATTVQPEILIVDEILGAGDAYFFTRSTARMQELIEGGATVLLVSHSLDQIVRFCDQTIWIDRGRVVMRGPSTEVVKAYERFVRELEDKRLLATNRKAQSGRFDAFERESYTDQVLVEVTAPDGPCDVSRVALLRDGVVEDAVAVGDAQDADSTQSASVSSGSGWSAPRGDDRFFRRVTDEPALAQFHLWFFYPRSHYAIEITYRAPEGPGRVVVRRAASTGTTFELPRTSEWTTRRLEGWDREEDASPRHAGMERPALAVSRWPGEGSLTIADVLLHDSNGNERAVFQADTPMSLRVLVQACRAGRFHLIPTATMYRADGILVSNHVGDALDLTLEAGTVRELRLDFAPLTLGDGHYVFSVGIYRTLSHVGDSEPYDLLDRSFEFEVVGNRPFENGVFHHDAAWTVGEPHVGANLVAG